MEVRVADRYLIRKAAFEVRASVGFHDRTAAFDELLDLDVLTAFGEALTELDGKVAFGGFVRRLKKLIGVLKNGKLWARFKDLLGVEKLTELPRKIKEWAKRGKDALKKIFKGVLNTFPLSMFFVSKKKMPGLTDALSRMLDKVPWLKDALKKVNTNIIQPLDRMMNKYIPRLKRPILAFVFAWVWFHVAEISWDFEGLFAGFTGGISLGELFASLPESGIGFIAAAFGLGYGALPVMFIARLIWLVHKHYIEWVPGKGFRIRWDEMGVDAPVETVAVV